MGQNILISGGNFREEYRFNDYFKTLFVFTEIEDKKIVSRRYEYNLIYALLSDYIKDKKTLNGILENCWERKSREINLEGYLVKTNFKSNIRGKESLKLYKQLITS